MADIGLTVGETYTFGRYNPYGSIIYTIISNGTDQAHRPMVINNNVTIRRAYDAADVTFIVNNDANTVNYDSIIEISVGGTSAGDPYILFDVGAATGYWAIGTDNSDSDAFKIQNSNTLGFTANEALKIDTAEEVYLRNISAGAGTYALKWTTTTGQLTYDTSTAKTKKNIVNANTSSYNDVLHLQPRQFNYRKTTDNNLYLGLIAEEVADINPLFAVYGPDIEWDENGKHTEPTNDNIVPVNINDRAIITALIGKIQELEQRIKKLENQ